MSACIEWEKSIRSNGYGAKSLNGIATTAHRWAWVQRYGQIPTGLFVLHKCDNPKCVNLDHLFLGTARDNRLDCIKKGRDDNGPRKRGENNHKSIFKESQVREMRVRHLAGETIKSINKRFGGNYSSIRRIVIRQSWRHIT